MKNFADRLLELIDAVENPSCVGLDPDLDQIPDSVKTEAMREFDVKAGESTENAWRASARALEIFNRRIIDETSDLVPAYKAQISYYERFGSHGMTAFQNTLRYVQSKGRIAIDDSKRGDIDRTAKAYAEAHLGVVQLINGANIVLFDADAMTVMPYLGSDGLKPFIDECRKYGKGIFVVDKTSNPSHIEFQSLQTAEKHGGRKLFEEVALKMEILGRDLKGDRDYSSLGLVVGAAGTTPEELRKEADRIRKLNPYAIFLVPGYGQQGGMGIDTVPCFNDDGYGAIVNNSSRIIFAYRKDPYKKKFRPEEFEKAARQSTLDMRDDIRGALKEAGIERWK